MKTVISDNRKIESLIQYYKDNELLIVGLNDSQRGKYNFYLQ